VRRVLSLLCLLTACSASKGLHDLRDTVDCALGCTLPNAVGVCGKSGCEIVSCNAGFGDCNADPADGCEVDLDADPLNCAFCDNACDTGTCHQGSCQDVNVIASPADDGRTVTDFVVDPGGVYYVLGSRVPPEAGAPAGVSLEVVAPAGGNPARLADFAGANAMLAQGDARLCVLVIETTDLSAPYRLLSLPKTGGDATLLSTGNTPTTAPMVLEPYVYWLTGGVTTTGFLDPDGGARAYQWTDQALHRALIAGGTEETLSTSAKPDYLSLLAAGSGVLLLTKGTLVELDGGLLGVSARILYSWDPASRAEVTLSTGAVPTRPVLRDGIIYWIATTAGATPGATNAGTTLASLPVGGGTPTTLWTSNAGTQAWEVAITDRYFFLTVALARDALRGMHSASGTYFYGILRVDRANGQASLVAKRDLPFARPLADGQYLYWLEAGQILRMLQSPN
jgi:hypothetical protein